MFKVNNKCTRTNIFHMSMFHILTLNIFHTSFCVCNADTAKNIVISPNFLVWKFCGKAQFPDSFGRTAGNYAETVPFHKISIPRN